MKGLTSLGWLRNLHDTLISLNKALFSSELMKSVCFVMHMLLSLFYMKANFHEPITKLYGPPLMGLSICLFLCSKMSIKTFVTKPLKSVTVTLLLFPAGAWCLFYGFDFEIFDIPLKISFLGGLWHVLLAYFTYILF